MNELEALSQTIQRAQNSESKLVADKLAEFGSLLEEMNTSLADVIGIIEKRPKEVGMLVDAIKGMGGGKVPQVDVHVPQAPAPVVHVQQDSWKSLQIKVGPAASDGSKTFTITRN